MRIRVHVPAIAGALALAGALTGCTLLSPPEPPMGPASGTVPSQQESRGRQTPAPAAPVQAAPPAAQPPAPVPEQRQFVLGPAAAALVSEAQTQERSRSFGPAAATLERALSIEPRNPLVWIALGRENILAGNAAQAYGMGRKALYLATGDPHAQASAWELIAASLRAQGRNDEAYLAEEKAATLSPR